MFYTSISLLKHFLVEGDAPYGKEPQFTEKIIKMRETVSPRTKVRGLNRDGSRNRTTILFLNKNEIAVSFFVSKLRIFRMQRNPKGFLAQEMNTFLCAKKPDHSSID